MNIGIMTDFGCKYLCPYLTKGIRCTRDIKSECQYRHLFSRLESVREEFTSLLDDDQLITALRKKGYSGELRKQQITVI